MAQGIILAGGFSSRIGMNKMTLPFRDKPLICQTIASMAPSVSQIFVVTGHYHDDINRAIKDIPNVTVIYNPNHSLGMFTSVLAGIEHVSEDVFIIPGDYPLVQASTYHLLLNAIGIQRVPTFQGRRGHPLFITKPLVEALKVEPKESNLKAFRNRYNLALVETNDPGILIDIDTIEDHQSLLGHEERI